MSRLSWTPVLRGDTYCSPACGGGCSLAAHEHSTREAKKLASSLGPQWAPRVWENLGWHYEAVAAGNRLKVSPCGDEYLAFLGPPGPGGYWTGRGVTPDAAVKDAVEKARRELCAIENLLEGLPL